MTRIAVLTGSTGGLGREMAKCLANDGCDLILINRSEERAELQVSELRKNFPNRNFQSYIADFLDLGQIRSVVDQILSQTPYIDYLFNNAAILTHRRIMSAQNIESHFAINVVAPYYLCQSLRSLLQNSAEIGHQPIIINVSSGAAFRVKKLDISTLQNPPEIGGIFGAYSNSKLALTAISTMMADELTKQNILVRSVNPGRVKTPMTLENESIPWWIRFGITMTPFTFQPAERQARKVVNAANKYAFSDKNGAFIFQDYETDNPKLAMDTKFTSKLRSLLDELIIQ